MNLKNSEIRITELTKRMPGFTLLTLGDTGGCEIASTLEKVRQAAPPGTRISPGVPPPGPRAHSSRQPAGLASTPNFMRLLTSKLHGKLQRAGGRG